MAIRHATVDYGGSTSDTVTPATIAATVAMPSAVASTGTEPWHNQSDGVAARNGTTSHTINFGFSAMEGRQLMVIVAGAVTHDITGWTQDAVATNLTEVAVFTKTATEGESSATVTHNGSDYPVAWTAFEFPAGMVVDSSTTEAGVADGTWPQLTGLDGGSGNDARMLFGIYSETSGATDDITASGTPGTGMTELVDSFTIHNGTTDGIHLYVDYEEDIEATSYTPTATLTRNGYLSEKITLAIYPGLVDFPDATNVGLAGVGLVHGDLTDSGITATSSNGEVLEDLDLASLTVQHDNVTIRRCRIQDTGLWIVHTGNAPLNLTIEDCDIAALGSTPNVDRYILIGEGASDGLTVQRCNLSGAENIIRPTGADNIVIRDNFIHSFSSPKAEPHYDGIEILSSGGSGHLIEHNHIYLDQNDTGTVNYTPEGSSSASNITVRNNRLRGGGYTLYFRDDQTSGSITNVVVTHNRLGTGSFGYYSIDTGVGITWSDNIDDITENTVSGP